MIVRKAKDEDFEQIYKLAEKHNIEIATRELILVVERGSEIIAFAIIKPTVQISPFISESPIASKKLYDEMINELQKTNNGIMVVQCFTDKWNEELFNKLGFEKVFDDKISMEKILTKEGE